MKKNITKNKQLKVNYLSVGNVGILPVKIPYLTVGRGSPRGIIIAAQHGTETAPLWAIKKFLQKASYLTGTAIIVPIANPFGFAMGSRNEILEGKDLNRQYPGDVSGDFSARLAQALVGLCQRADFVIDLHSFSRQALFLAGYSKQKNNDQSAVKKLLQLIKSDAVWVVKEDEKEDRRYQGSLDSYLTKEKIPVVFLEIPNYSMYQNKIINRVAKNILCVFQGFKNKKIKKIAPLTEYTAKYSYSDESGLFEPVVTPLKKVKTGQVIASIYRFPDFKLIPVRCQISGIVLTIKSNGVVRTGSKIYSIGVKN